MSDLDQLKLKALAAVREVMMAVEFAEQAHDAIEAGAFQSHSDTEIDSAESALITVRSCVMEMEEHLGLMKRKAEVPA